ncbi:hypothetical protein [Nocardiopsis synnemataformans]|uniref:hypothetical protein n=1 Tax=Nocardiopsis synnemataformans TaxID=61305 RepID=UPI003EBAA2A6
MAKTPQPTPDPGAELAVAADAAALVPARRPSGRMDRATIELLQHRLGVRVDGVWSFMTTRILQHRLGVKVDGLLGSVTVHALQEHVGAEATGVWPSVRAVYNSGRVEFTAERSPLTLALQAALDDEGKFR